MHMIEAMTGWANDGAVRALHGLMLLVAGASSFAALGCGVDTRQVTTGALQPGAGGSVPEGGSSAPPAPPDPMGAPPGVTPDEPAPNVDAGGAAAPMSCTPGAPAPDCAEVVCPGDDVCRDFPALVTAGTCTAEARCASVADCAPVWTAGARGGEACLCTEASCTLELLEPCSTASDCQSGACAATAQGANVCCAAACADTEVCTDDGAGCVPAAVCTDGDRRCSGANYQRCGAGQWVTETVCGEVGCSLAVGGCLARVGEACTTNDQCGEGACLPTPGGVTICCTAPCGVDCRACDITGLACENLADDADCGVVGCPSDSTCRNYPASVESGRCVNGRCGSGTEVCEFEPRGEGQECAADTVCDGNGDCSVALLAPGDPCSSGNQCASGFCVDGVCCNQDCDDECETCAGTGLCRAPATDAACDPVFCSQFNVMCTGQTSDITLPACAAQGQCSGVEACLFAPAGTGCNGGIAGIGTCDGQGSCLIELIDFGETTIDF